MLESLCPLDQFTRSGQSREAENAALSIRDPMRGPPPHMVECSSQPGAYEGTKRRIVMLRATCASPLHHNLDWGMSGPGFLVQGTHHFGAVMHSRLPCQVKCDLSMSSAIIAGVGVRTGSGSALNLGLRSWCEADDGTQQRRGEHNGRLLAGAACSRCDEDDGLRSQKARRWLPPAMIGSSGQGFRRPASMR